MTDNPFEMTFDEAAEFLAQKVSLPTESWTDIREKMHARAFVVAGANNAALVADFQNSLIRAKAEGMTLDDWRDEFDQIVDKHGWSYKGERGWRSAVIYNTNMRMSEAAGRWAQALEVADDVKARGGKTYLRYYAILDGRTRPEHRSWHGIILPLDHSFWDTHYPPNGWNCRCTVQVVTDKDLKRYGWAVTADADIPDLALEMRQLRTPHTIETVMVPQGIDTGFGYNIGKAAWGLGADRMAIERHGPWTPLKVPANTVQASEPLVPRQTDIRPGSGANTVSEVRARLRDALGADSIILTDPAGDAISISQAISDHMAADQRRIDGRERYFPYMRELIEDPQEIWIGFAEAEDGRIFIRRRYVSLLDMGGGDKVIGLVADADGNRWSGMTFFQGSYRALNNLRQGLRIYKAGDGD